MIEMDEINMLKYNDDKTELLIDRKYLKEYNLKKDEILKCKENGFILIGKTGVGKTSLLNLLYGEDIGKVGHSSFSETKKSNYYCIKEKIKNDYIYFCIVDTPGLYDTDGLIADDRQKIEIINLISKNKIKIKGLLFLSNFQNERFDASEQLSLIEYNHLFPMKDFWERIILIFTHYYGDPDGDSKEEIQERSNILFSDIIKKIIEKIKNVSTPIDFMKIKKKYINIYSKTDNEMKLKNNEDIRKDLIFTLSEYINFCPMFNKKEIFHFEKYELQENDEFVFDLDLTLYLDSNDNIINKDFRNLKKFSKKDIHENRKQKIELFIQTCIKDQQGNLINIYSKNNNNNINQYLSYIFIIFSIIGIIIFYIYYKPMIIFFLCTLLIGFGIYYKSKKNRNILDLNEIHQIIKNQNINDLILGLIENKFQ